MLIYSVLAIVLIAWIASLIYATTAKKTCWTKQSPYGILQGVNNVKNLTKKTEDMHMELIISLKTKTSKIKLENEG